MVVAILFFGGRVSWCTQHDLSGVAGALSTLEWVVRVYRRLEAALCMLLPVVLGWVLVDVPLIERVRRGLRLVESAAWSLFAFTATPGELPLPLRASMYPVMPASDPGDCGAARLWLAGVPHAGGELFEAGLLAVPDRP